MVMSSLIDREAARSIVNKSICRPNEFPVSAYVVFLFELVTLFGYNILGRYD
jgi:hypothetical protein